MIIAEKADKKARRTAEKAAKWTKAVAIPAGTPPMQFAALMTAEEFWTTPLPSSEAAFRAKSAKARG